jgi:hypothetical protein
MAILIGYRIPTGALFAASVIGCTLDSIGHRGSFW